MRTSLFGAALLLAAILAPAGAAAVPIAISGSNGISGNGSFTGTFEYTPIDAAHGTIDISLTNITGGFITAFVFNLPTGVTVSNATLASSDSDFDDVLGGSAYANSVNGAPFGRFDIGAGIGNSFEGGGDPHPGIPAGGLASFQFSLTGTGLGALNSAAFLSTLSAPPGDGHGVEEFVVRFRGTGGGDKVPVDTIDTGDTGVDAGGAPIPEPGTLALLSLGLASLSARRRARRQ